MATLPALLIAIAVLLILLSAQSPVAYSLMLAGAIGLYLLVGPDYTLSVLGSAPFETVSSFALTVIPTFILIGVFAVHGRIADQVYRIANYAFRNVSGGLGCATVAACAGFAAVTGSSVATAATMARLSIRQMLRYGYPPHFAGGIVAASGTLGVLIPPSIILVIYSILTRESTGRLLLAGVLPGLLTAALYATYIAIRSRSFVRAAAEVPVGPDGEIAAAAAPPEAEELGLDRSGQESLRTLPWRGLVRVAIIFVIIVGGIYSGTFTATESGAIGAIASLVMMLIEVRREGPRRMLNYLGQSFREAASTTTMVFMIMVGSSIFSAFLVRSGAPQQLATFVSNLDAPPHVVLILFLVMLIPLGMALEAISILVVSMPLLYPAVVALGFDGVLFGILTVKFIEIGLVTPPVGVGAYVVSGTTPEVTAAQVFRGVVPFLFLDLLVVALLILFPNIALWLPNLAA
ncbi:MAG TPA: TRAP transporter large permease [Egicoccus sp.]|nr:TRAP transporter large permease [Egicoccus sp.]HSK24609.1 TRAP transporter large permease [Egicoccus sp.]